MADGTGDAGSENSGTTGFEFNFGDGSSSDSGSSNDGSELFGLGSGDAFGSVDPNAGRDGDDFDPAIHVGRDKRNADGSYRRKRGKRGSGSNGGRAKSAKSSKTSVEGIERALVGIHGMIAAFVKAPELALEKDESKPYAEAVAEVAKHYDIPEVADVTMAWIGLAMVMGTIYGPRYILIQQRLRGERAKPVNAKPEKVVNLDRTPFTPEQTYVFDPGMQPG